MVNTTPFHPRLAELNTAELWGHWSGHLSATQYTTAPKHEYFGVRNAVGIFDASPLYKYAISGRDAEQFLGGIFARDIRTCRPGRAQYTVWCDDRGFVLEDGVVFRHSANDFLLTAAEPNLSFLLDQVGSLEVTRRARSRRSSPCSPYRASGPGRPWPRWSPRSRSCTTSGMPRRRSPAAP